MDPHNVKHSVATAVSTFRIASHSVSEYMSNDTIHAVTTKIQIRAWPGQKFLIELTGWDQFSQPTMANARLLFTASLQV